MLCALILVSIQQAHSKCFWQIQAVICFQAISWNSHLELVPSEAKCPSFFDNTRLLQLLHTEGADASSGPAVNARDALVGQAHGVCLWHWHSQSKRDQS